MRRDIGGVTQGAGPAALAVWRHPRPQGAAGRCVGRIDLAVDPRRVRRLAGRIRRAARREGRPTVVFTSPLRRCRLVGACLRRLGWTHRIDPDLIEADFGTWDGEPWDSIGSVPIDAWMADFADHRPGGGESVRSVLRRCERFLAGDRPWGASVVTHGGWCSALSWWGSERGRAGHLPGPSEWPAAIGYAKRLANIDAGVAAIRSMPRTAFSSGRTPGSA